MITTMNICKRNMLVIGRRLFSSSNSVYDRAIAGAAKLRDPVMMISSFLGGIGIFGGMVAYVVGDRFQLASKLKEESIRHEKDNQVWEAKLKSFESTLLAIKERRESALRAEKELRETSVKLVKAQGEAEMRQRILDFGFNANYRDLRDSKDASKDK